MKKKLNRKGIAVKKVAFESLTEDSKRFVMAAVTRHRKIVLKEISPEEAKHKEEKRQELKEKFNLVSH